MILLDYIRVSTLAKKLKFTTAYIYQLIEANKITPPAVKIDGVYFVNKNAKIVK